MTIVLSIIAGLLFCIFTCVVVFDGLYAYYHEKWETKDYITKNSIQSQIDKLEKLVTQLYSDKDDDINVITDQINDLYEKLEKSKNA